MKKVLMLASVASMIDQFNMENLKLLQNLGYKVDVACNFVEGSTCSDEKIEQLKKNLTSMNIRCFQIDFARSITNMPKNLKAYWQLEALLKNNNYSFIHCHSPIGGVTGRIACKKTSTKCIYTAHGFHFFKGGPTSSWVLFYPIEKLLSKYTDILITINNEDFELALKKMRAKNVVKVPGVGVDINKIKNCAIDRKEYREKLGYKESDILILSVGELTDRKNHAVIIEAIHKLKNSDIKYAIVGKGPKGEDLSLLIEKYNLENQVKLLGFRTDIPELLHSSDIFCFPSKREGLGLAAIEGMAAGLPLLSSNINGINDYSIDGTTGYSCNPTDINGFAHSIEKIINEKRDYSITNKNIAQKYDIGNVSSIMKKIYSTNL